MVRLMLAGVLALVVVAADVGASIVVWLPDEFDDHRVIASFQETPAVAAFSKDMDAFKERLRARKEADILAMFGKPRPKPAQTFAMPVAQRRGFGMSGLRHADAKLNKDHKEFYLIGTGAAVEIYYALDGISPYIILLYLRVDDTFPRLTKDNLETRLAWERKRWHDLLAYVDRRADRVLGKNAGADRPTAWPVPKASVPSLAAADLEELWADLERADERRLYQVIDRAAAMPAQTIATLARIMPPDPVVDAKQVADLIDKLGSKHFADRTDAMRKLEALHWLAKPALEAALRGQPPLETATRLRQLLAQMDVERNPALRRQQRAVMVLAAIDSPEAHHLLGQWAARTPAAFLTQEARSTLAWLQGR